MGGLPGTQDLSPHRRKHRALNLSPLLNGCNLSIFAAMESVEKIKRPERHYVPEDFSVKDWDSLKPFFEELVARPLYTVSELRTWFQDRSELESIVAEDLGWRYIRMTCYTENENYSKDYQFFIQEIQPHVAPFIDKLNKKAATAPGLSDLKKEEGFGILIRNMLKEIEIFREENIPLFTEIQTLSQQYAQLSGAMTISWEGQEITLPQASVMLLSPDRTIRKDIYERISSRRLADKKILDELFSKLIDLRHRVAVHADFENFRDYMFKALGRFDYTPSDCFAFHEAVREEVVPLLDKLALERKDKMEIDVLRPWDKAVDPEGRPPLKPFTSGEDLTDKSIEVFTRLDPFLGNCLQIMKSMGHLDLESRKGKAPGGYNYPLAEIGVPFIFMNATSTLRDLVTIMHEGGHAIHNFLTRELPLSDFKSTPSEVAELASMAMELISMDHWDVFFSDASDLKRAKREHLEDIIETLPWVATIDKFQHWIYTHPAHNLEERKAEWVNTFSTFSDRQTNWNEYEEARNYLWQKQLHLYEVPFYYIEYGMAQLGAIAVWKNFRKDPKAGLQGYLNALKLGNLKSIPEIYSAAGINFDFSKEYIRSLMHFVDEELAKI